LRKSKACWASAMKYHILTLFPGMFTGPFDDSIVKSARDNGIIDISIIDIRDFTSDKHRTADDYPFGGGSGMILKPEPVFLAVESVLVGVDAVAVPVILVSPQGRRFDQTVARELAAAGEIILICGRYKGVDERIRDHLATDEISIGDYVISGGELGAMVIVDAVTRLLPGALGDFESAETDSFYNGMLECGQYTRPRDFRGYTVPEVLLGGNHEAIRRWRRKDSLKKTLRRRPDLFDSVKLLEEDRLILEEIEAEESLN
jgi:tRNA (guanine37-N1)-methyltransferase